ncbi:MAG: hypothetical protein ABIO79_11410 [Ferruginibacter sp.]
MKKLIAIFVILVLGITIKVNAQVHDISITKVTTTGDGQGDVILFLPGLKEGTNRLMAKELKGTLTFVKNGNTFSDVIFKDDAGRSTRLTPTRGGSNGAPKPECKTTLPDACFSSPDKKIGMCLCKPGNLTNGGEETYTVKFYQTYLGRTVSN